MKMLNTEKERIEELCKELQKKLMRALEWQQARDKPTDFAAGFAQGIQVATATIFINIVNNFMERDLAEIVTFAIRMSLELHETAHVLNSESQSCEELEESKRVLVKFLLHGMFEAIFSPKRKESKDDSTH
jgi:hypothetical protein